MNRFKSVLIPALAVGALMIGAFAVAQDGGQGRRMGRGFGGGFGGGGNTFFLLRRDDVQTDLQLTSDQKTKLQDLMTSMRGNRGERGARTGGQGGNGGTPPTDAERQARRAEMQSRMAEMKKNIDAILTPAQITRLDEISIQLRGNMALLESDVQNKLGLSNEQKGKIKDLQSKMQDANQAVGQKMQDNTITRDQAFQSFQKNNDIMKDQLGKVLTRSQADKLKAMGGAPFKADPNESQGFGFGRRGGRRGGGGGGANRFGGGGAVGG